MGFVHSTAVEATPAVSLEQKSIELDDLEDDARLRRSIRKMYSKNCLRFRRSTTTERRVEKERQRQVLAAMNDPALW